MDSHDLTIPERLRMLAHVWLREVRRRWHRNRWRRRRIMAALARGREPHPGTVISLGTIVEQNQAYKIEMERLRQVAMSRAGVVERALYEPRLAMEQRYIAPDLFSHIGTYRRYSVGQPPEVLREAIEAERLVDAEDHTERRG